MRPTGHLGEPEHATKTALRRLARRHQHLTEEIAETDIELKDLVTVAAPHLLALPGRLRYDARTRTYADRRTQQGLSKPEIIRCLKRYVAREIYAAQQPANTTEELAKAA